MKKYILMLAVASTAALVACGNKDANTEVTEAPTATEVVEEVTETVTDSLSAAADTLAAAADSLKAE